MSIGPSSTRSQLSWPATFPSTLSAALRESYSIPWPRPCRFALVGALILTLTLVPVLTSYWFKKGIREHQNRAYDWMKRVYATQLDWALARPKLILLIAALIFGATLLLVPFIGGEFMPHLDEGALWVRATMPYTISFEEASRIAPQIRDILMSYPASHHCRL